MITNKEMGRYPKSLKEVYIILENQNDLIRITELHNSTYFSERSVRRALKKLIELELVLKLPDFDDMRSFFLITKSNLEKKKENLSN